jgi:hypothetical protein
MKTIFVISFVILSMAAFSQNKDIDNIFSKFDGKNGVVSVNVNKDMMSLAAQFDSLNVQTKELLSQVNKIRILAFENATSEDKVAFESLAKSLSLKDYKELMVVKDKDMNVKMLLKENQNRIDEFLLLVTGGNHPALISITGNIDPKLLGQLGHIPGMKMQGMGMEQLAKMHMK